MEVGKQFEDIQSYNASMRKAVDSKLFFLKKLDEELDFIFLDFGCADAAILQEVERRCSSSLLHQDHHQYYIGYDISETMIKIAKTKWDGVSKNVTLSSNWAEILKTIHNTQLKSPWLKVIVLVSSVLHEAYSYDTNLDFWKHLFELNAEYIVFRDMMWSSCDNRKSPQSWVDLIRQRNYSSNLNSFELRWGSIEDLKTMTHYLLKYRWTINWERENSENYFPITLTQFLSEIGQKYEPQYLERFSIPYIQDRIYETFGFRFNLETHVKAIFRLRK